MRVLVVEDNALILLALVDELESHGHTIIGPARSSGEALLILRRQRPDVALVDIDLEEMGSGLHLACKLRDDFDVPVVLTTGRPEAARSSDCAVGLLTKPYSIDGVPSVIPVVRAIWQNQAVSLADVPQLELLPYRRTLLNTSKSSRRQ